MCPVTYNANKHANSSGWWAWWLEWRMLEDVILPPTGCCLAARGITWRQRRQLLIMLVGGVEGVAKNIMMPSSVFIFIWDTSNKISQHERKHLTVWGPTPITTVHGFYWLSQRCFYTFFPPTMIQMDKMKTTHSLLWGYVWVWVSLRKVCDPGCQLAGELFIAGVTQITGLHHPSSLFLHIVFSPIIQNLTLPRPQQLRN